MVQLSSTRDAMAAIAHAEHIDVRAYTLHGPIVDALEAAAKRGAHVVVELEGTPYNDRGGHLAAENERLVAALRAAGVEGRLGAPEHAKVIAADNSAYLDDKNWGEGDLVLRDDVADAASIPMVKHEALAAEARLLRDGRRGNGVVVASESFGRFNVVYSALDALATAGASPRLIVNSRDLEGNGREREALEALVRDGVRVRTCDDSEKLAVAGGRAWIGSANATVAFGPADLPDWGLCTSDGEIVRAVRGRIEAEWSRGKDVALAA